MVVAAAAAVVKPCGSGGRRGEKTAAPLPSLLVMVLPAAAVLLLCCAVLPTNQRESLSVRAGSMDTAVLDGAVEEGVRIMDESGPGWLSAVGCGAR